MKFIVILLSVLVLTIGIAASSVWAANLALSLDGRGDYVDVGNSTTLMFSGNFTLECWVKPVGHPTSAWGAFICRDALPLARNYWFGYDYGPDMVSFRNIGVSEHSPPNVLTMGSWTHYAVTIDPNQRITIYINGKPAMLSSTGAERSDETRRMINVPTNIGASGKRGVDFFSGLIDEVRIWDIARTEEQIQAGMNTTLVGQEDGLVGYWNFDDGTANDLSLNSNDGVLHSDAQIVESPLPDEFIQAGTITIGLEYKAVNPGDQFAMSISVFSGEALHSFVLDLTFDPSILQAAGVKEGSFLGRDGTDATSWQTPTTDNENGVITDIRCSRTGEDGIEGRGIIATVTFEAIEMGNTDLSIPSISLLSPAGEEMAASVRKGSADVYLHGSISGVVLDSVDNLPIQGVKMEVSRGNFTFGFSARSDDDGIYTIDGVPIGDFDVTAIKDDYIPETIPEIRVEQGKNTGDVDINLTSFDTASTVTIMTPIAVGEPATDFVLQDIDGNQIIPSDFAGKPIILNFWDSTSEHCQRQIPHLDALYKKYKSDDLVVMGVSKEMANNDALEFARSQMSYITILNGAEAFQAYGVTSIPCTYYIDKTGEVRSRDVGFPSGGEAQMEQEIKALLGENE